jgi:hypothetical protein
MRVKHSWPNTNWTPAVYTVTWEGPHFNEFPNEKQYLIKTIAHATWPEFSHWSHVSLYTVWTVHLFMFTWIVPHSILMPLQAPYSEAGVSTWKRRLSPLTVHLLLSLFLLNYVTCDVCLLCHLWIFASAIKKLVNQIRLTKSISYVIWKE